MKQETLKLNLSVKKTRKQLFLEELNMAAYNLVRMRTLGQVRLQGENGV